MNGLSAHQADTRGLAATASVRELTADEVDEVAGGVLPILIVAAAVVVATALQESGEESPSEGDEGGDGGDGEAAGDD